jgi:hypothetical protein
MLRVDTERSQAPIQKSSFGSVECIKIPRPQGQGIPEMISGHLALSFINEKTSKRFF